MGAHPQGTEPAPVRRDHDRAMRRVGEALADRYPEIGQAMAARILEEIPEYQDAAPPRVTTTRRSGAIRNCDWTQRTNGTQ